MIDFLGIGAQKAGTTWLYRMLDRHPDVRFPGGKELHFWNRAPLAGQGAAAYLAQFPAAEPTCRQGEITPAYALLDVDTIGRLHALNPALRIVFMLRHPIERAWSAALMALQRADLAIDEASDAWFLDHFRSRGSLGRGDYETTLRRWRSVFPHEQLLVLLHEDIAARPSELLRRCARHLAIDPAPFEALPAQVLGQRVFAGAGHPIRASLRAALCELYRPRLASLVRYEPTVPAHWLDEADRAQPAASPQTGSQQNTSALRSSP